MPTTGYAVDTRQDASGLVVPIGRVRSHGKPRWLGSGRFSGVCASQRADRSGHCRGRRRDPLRGLLNAPFARFPVDTLSDILDHFVGSPNAVRNCVIGWAKGVPGLSNSATCERDYCICDESRIVLRTAHLSWLLQPSVGLKTYSGYYKTADHSRL